FILSGLPENMFGDSVVRVAELCSPASSAPVTFALDSSSVGCTVTGDGTVHLTGAALGTDKCVIAASTAATANYLAGGPTTQSFKDRKNVVEGKSHDIGSPGNTFGITDIC